MPLAMSDQAHRPLAGYSKGMRQRIKLAQALVHDPEVLLLDEPMSGIDPVGRAEMVELFRGLARQGMTLLISSHELDELEKMTDHVAIMARGRLAAVGPVARKTSSRLITSFTGRLALRDSASATGSMNTVVLPPKPPPISDGVTRSLATSMPSRAAQVLRIM